MDNRHIKEKVALKKDNNKMVYHLKDGDYTATIYLNKFLIDKGTLSQIHKMLIHPATNHMRIMPDCHRGSGCCVGYTSYLTTKIVPKFIGGDIGCGVLTYPLKFDSLNIPHNNDNIILDEVLINNISLKNIDLQIRKLIPMGSGPQNVHSWYNFDSTIIKKYVDETWTKIIDEAGQFAKAYKKKYGYDIYKYIPDYGWDWLNNKCQQIKSDIDYDLRSLGTLGGGNHFIELNYNNNKDQIYVTVHSGSRSIGQKICQYHQNKINETKYMDRDKYKELEKKTARQFRGKQFYQIMEDIKDKLLGDRHSDYLEGEEAYQYYFDMIFAQNISQLNRRIMLNRILSIIYNKPENPQHILYEEDNVIESIHNYIDFNDFIIRKGAIQSHKNKPCIIALNMKEGILLCNGKGNIEWNYSAAHGAGRVINRQKAFQKLNITQFKEEMKHIYSSSVNEDTLDESPMVYRNTDTIKKALKGTIEVKEQLYPILNIKGLN